MNKKEKIEAIYNRLAQTKKYNDGDICSHCWNVSHWESEYTLPVMIWDLLYYIETNMPEWFETVWLSLKSKIVNVYWKEKRKPIEEQSEECIDYIYNLI